MLASLMQCGDGKEAFGGESLCDKWRQLWGGFTRDSDQLSAKRSLSFSVLR